MFEGLCEGELEGLGVIEEVGLGVGELDGL